MKKTIKAAVLMLMTAALLISSAGAYFLPENVTTDMMDADFWISKCAAPDAVIMTGAQIEALNEQIVDTEGDFVTDLTTCAETVDGTALIKSLKSFEITGTYYIDGKAVAADYYDAWRRNIDNISQYGTHPVQYGLAAENAPMKGYPYFEVLSDAPDDPEFDQFYCTEILTGEPLVIKSVTTDGKWYYAVVTNCGGYVPADKVALCSSRAQWLGYIEKLKASPLVVTGDRFSLEQSYVNPALSGLELSMGTVLPLASAGEQKEFFDGRTVYGNHLVWLPTRAEDGSCKLMLGAIPKSRDVSVGYVNYTQRNYLTQIFKLAGNRYGWGGMLGAMDCSQYIDMVSRCFGFRLARNTTWQAMMPSQVIDLAGYEDSEKAAVISALPAGTALQFNGHTMFYIGDEGGRQYVISALGNYVPEGGSSVQRVRTVTVNTLDVKRANGNTWLHEMTCAIVLKNVGFNDISGSPQSAAILSLSRAGILSGSEGCFYPDKPLTRRETAVIVCRLLKLTQDEAAAETAFTDLSGWGAGYIGGALNAGILSGCGNGIFSPDGQLTGTQLNTIMQRVWTRLECSGTAPSCQKTDEPVTRAEAAAAFSALLAAASTTH